MVMVHVVVQYSMHINLLGFRVSWTQINPIHVQRGFSIEHNPNPIGLIRVLENEALMCFFTPNLLIGGDFCCLTWGDSSQFDM